MIRRMGIAACLALAACGDAGPGAVSGEAFLAQDLDRVVNLPGLSVHLLAEEEEPAALDSALAKICPRAGGATVGTPREADARAWEARGRMLAARSRLVARADARSHFAFDSVPPGRYRLWADTTVGDERWTWLVPVRVSAGDTARADLTNANPDENPFRCRE